MTLYIVKNDAVAILVPSDLLLILETGGGSGEPYSEAEYNGWAGNVASRTWIKVPFDVGDLNNSST